MASSIDAYIAAQPEAARAALRRVRATIRKTLPTATETISYGIPAFRTDAGVVIHFAGWKAHWSLYPASAAVVEALGEALLPYAVSRGTIRFPLTRVPVRLIARIVRIRAAETAARAAARTAAKRQARKIGASASAGGWTRGRGAAGRRTGKGADSP